MSKVIVITGGIGSGKSEVCRILGEMGLTAQYNADSRVKSLYRTSPTLLGEVEEALGRSLRDDAGDFVPERLAGIIFSDPEALAAVEGKVFPALKMDFDLFAEAHRDDETIIFESATILEKPYFKGFGDKIILVEAPYSTRLERACMRDGARPEAVEARMANQRLLNSVHRVLEDSCIDAVITNDGDLEELKNKTREVISHLFDN